MSVLILAAEQDPTADAVVHALAEHDTVVHRLDTAWFPAALSIDAELVGGRWTGRLSTPHRSVVLEEVHAVWYRSPGTFRFPEEMTAVERRHALVETKLGLGGVLTSLDVLWVNHPNRVADASYKPGQLVLAARCGLTVVPTLITSRPDAVRRFVAQTDHPVVGKMLGSTVIGEEGRFKAARTRLVTGEDLVDLTGIEVAAHQFQHFVAGKAFDARVIAIGDDLFGFAIHATSAEGRLDFRRDYPGLRYERLDVPDAVATGIRMFLKASGLSFGALDFVVDDHDGWLFLENNPGGQYGWVEAATGAPLTSALAALLVRGGTT